MAARPARAGRGHQQRRLCCPRPYTPGCRPAGGDEVSPDTRTSPPNPADLPFILETSPGERQADRAWVVWGHVEEIDRETGEVDWDKPPLNARTGRPASSTNCRTWSSFAEASEAYRRGGLDGVGY